MTSLPMPTGWPDPGFSAASSLRIDSNVTIGNTRVEDQDLVQDRVRDHDKDKDQNKDQNEDELFLLRAFRSFAEAAGSLEHSYGLLRTEVERLRRELEKSNSDLAQSLEENRGMRTHLDRILEGLPCGVIVAAGDDSISRANPEALRLLGIEGGSAITAPRSLAELPEAVRQLFESARTQGNEPERRVAGESGSARWLAVRHASIVDGANSAAVFILRDVSERKRLEEARARLRREQALAEMSAVLAHEIRNPLGSLELFAGLLAEAELDGECRQWVEHVQAGLRTLAATVNNVLQFHSLPEPERSPVDLGQLLGWARDFFLPLARQSRITLSVQNRVSGVFIAADRHRLEQVLLNLVLNAVRAMPGGGWIELGGRTVDHGETVELTVADTGPGISDEHLPRIYEPGFSTRAGSPGLGLAVCRRIVEQHGGSLTATSPPGRGASFTLLFPLACPRKVGRFEAGSIEEGPLQAGPSDVCPFEKGVAL
jgi:two-component system sensor histidine kinase FlrB